MIRRDVDFELRAPRRPHDEDKGDEAPTPEAWFGGDLHVTTFANALSLLFPEGERFFVDAVRKMKPRIEDPELLEAIAGFIGQEAMHAREHRALNEVSRAYHGAIVDEMEAEVLAILNRVRKNMPARGRLAVTCALEHFTAMMAEHLLTDREAAEAMHPRVRSLWLWHALEESEHKAVAFDVYQATGGGYAVRAGIMLATSVVFFVEMFRVHAKLLAAKGELGNLRGWARLLGHLYVRPGMFRKLVPAWLDYFRPTFHPNDRDTRALIAAWRERLFGERGEIASRLRSPRLHPQT